MSHYAKRNPENPHGLQGGHFPQPPSKFAGMAPDQVLDKMAEDNAQERRYVEHGPAMLAIVREDATLPCHRMGGISCRMHPDPAYPWCQPCRARAIVAKVEGKD